MVCSILVNFLFQNSFKLTHVPSPNWGIWRPLLSFTDGTFILISVEVSEFAEICLPKLFDTNTKAGQIFILINFSARLLKEFHMAPLAMESSQIGLILINFEIKHSKTLASNHLIMVVKKIFVRRRAFPAQKGLLLLIFTWTFVRFSFLISFQNTGCNILLRRF